MGYRVLNGKLYPVGNFPEISKPKAKVNSNTENAFKDILKTEIDKNAILQFQIMLLKGCQIET